MTNRAEQDLTVQKVFELLEHEPTRKTASASHADDIMGEMVQILGFSKAAEDAAAEFKAKLAGAASAPAVDALYAEYKDRLKWATTQEDWEALVNARKGQLRTQKASEEEPILTGTPDEMSVLTETLAELVEIADALDKYGFAGLAGVIDDTILKMSAAKDRPPKRWFEKVKKDTKKQYKDYGDERIDKIVGGIWHDFSSKEKEKIRREYA